MILLYSQHKLVNKFPVEAGYFNDRERIIPDCPFKKTPFGIKQSSSNDAEIGRHLNSYLKVDIYTMATEKQLLFHHYFYYRNYHHCLQKLSNVIS